MSGNEIQLKGKRNRDAANDGERRYQSAVGPILIFFITLYFGYHIFQGDRGVISWIRLQKKVDADEAELKKLRQLKENLERQVYLLRPDSLDIDMLEERARIVLNYARPDEIIIHDAPVPVPSQSALKKSSYQKRPL
jgi:cell division protein FtsB